MENKLTVSPSPHIRGTESTRKIMMDVIIALCPAGAMSIYLFGLDAALRIVVTVASCVVAEALSRRVMKRDNTVGDLSAVVTGLLLAYNLPSTLPLWMAVVGAFIAIVVVKQLFGGIGQNFVNPAIAARVALLVSFPSAMTTFTVPNAGGTVGTATATPLAQMASGEVESLPDLLHMFIGIRPGSLGETSVLLILCGGIYLMARRVIKPIIPLTYIATVFVLTWLLGADPVYQIMSGGLFLGAFFMATDYTTSPLTNKGKFIFAVGCGVITVVIRLFCSLPEGVSYSIMLMNILVPHIERLTVPKPVGEGARA